MSKDTKNFLSWMLYSLVVWLVTNSLFTPIIALLVHIVTLLTTLLIYTMYLLYKKGWL